MSNLNYRRIVEALAQQVPYSPDYLYAQLESLRSLDWLILAVEYAGANACSLSVAAILVKPKYRAKLEISK